MSKSKLLVGTRPPKLNKPKAEKYKVMPGLAMDAKTLRARVESRSINISQSGKDYASVEIDRIGKQSKVEQAREYVEETHRISDLTKKVQNTVKKQAQVKGTTTAENE